MEHSVLTLGLGTRAAACMLYRKPSALIYQETSRPLGPFLGYILLLSLLWVSKAASQDSQGQRKHIPLSGQTYPSQSLYSPLQSGVSAMAQQRLQNMEDT